MSADDLISDAELLAWLDEDLSSSRMSEIETQLRASTELQQRAAQLISLRDQGTVTVGEVWRRHHLSCPSRHELGSYLLQACDAGTADYIRFHLETIGCRTCQANAEDLQQAQSTTQETLDRRQRIFASSVSRLKKKGEGQ